MQHDAVITGIGMVTPAGDDPAQVLAAVAAGRSAVRPSPYGGAFACDRYAPAAHFQAAQIIGDSKTLRLMNRDAQLAVAAARHAMQDAGITVDRTYPAGRIGLYGATGLTGLPTDEAARLVRCSAAPDGSLDLRRFGAEALKRVRPVLSFKILANMPICFVSIFERLCGPNAVYTPWEGQGAQAIAAGLEAIRCGRVPCALVGGCDVKTHAFSFIALQQLGVFDSWTRHGRGAVPGEGAAFLVLEDARAAAARGARVYARLRAWRMRCHRPSDPPGKALAAVLDGLPRPAALVAAANGDPAHAAAEQQALAAALKPRRTLTPKAHLGDLFAAAAALQVGLAACWIVRDGISGPVVADCFGHGSQQAAFVLEAA